MDREEECVCCHEIEQVANKNQEVMEYTKPTLPYNCITDNPGFHTVCLDRWVLQAAWLDYKQQYGSTAYEGPEHKISRHVAYRPPASAMVLGSSWERNTSCSSILCC
jgi:hypothetical protein